MVLQSTGVISLSHLQTEFGGSNPISMSEYYSNTSYVSGNLTTIPTSGLVNLGAYYSKGNPKGVYDNISSGSQSSAVAMYSLKLLKGFYTGPVVKLRRDSDNTVADFYANTSGTLGMSTFGTGTSLSTWLGAATAYVQQWYDQSGRAKHLTQGTTTSQPQLINSSGEYGLYLNGDRQISGANVFDSSTVTNAHIMYTSREIARALNFLLNLNGTDSIARFSCHAPWVDGTWYFDAGDVISNRCVWSLGTSVNQRVVFSGYKSSTDGKSGARVNQRTVATSTSNTAATVTGGLALNSWQTAGLHPGVSTANHHIYSLLIFNNKLASNDETTISTSL
jgi:hypothetical protein